jgi:hypothetical protein
MRRIKAWVLFFCAVVGAFGGLSCIFVWFGIQPKDIGAVTTRQHWVWPVIAVVLFAVTLSFSLYTFILQRRPRPALTEQVISKIEKAGMVRGLAGRADYLAQVLDDVHEQFVQNQRPMPNPLAKNCIPDVIKEHVDKELWRFRDKYRAYLGSVESVVPGFSSKVTEEGFPCEHQNYLVVSRKIKAHADTLRKLANDLLMTAKEEHAENEAHHKTT